MTDPEHVVLGGLLLDNTKIHELEGLKLEHFEHTQNGIVFQAILALHAKGARFDLVMVTDHLRTNGELDKAGGVAYISALTNDVPTIANIRYYVRKVRESADRREAQRLCKIMLERLESDMTADTSQILGELSQTISELTAARSERRIFARAGEIVVSAPEWLVESYLERGTLACIFGDPGTGKTFAAVDIACCAATGTDFQGHKVGAAGPVVYVAGEGRSGLLRRIRAWCIYRAQDFDCIPVYVSSRSVLFGDDSELAAVSLEIDHIRPLLIVVDTLSRNISGDENSSVDMPRFVQTMDQLRYRYGSTVLVVHHSPHAEKSRSRGHTSFRGALDWEFRMSRDDVIRFENTKTKDYEPPETLAFELREVELDIRRNDGNPVTSAILYPVPFEPKTAKKKPTGKWQKLALETLERLTAEHRENLVASGRDPDEARVMFDDWRAACETAGMSGKQRPRFYEASNSLQDLGCISVHNDFVEVLNGSGCTVQLYGPPKGGPVQYSTNPIESDSYKPDKNRTKNRTQAAQGEIPIF